MIMGPAQSQSNNRGGMELGTQNPPSSSRHRLFLMEINYKACNLVCHGEASGHFRFLFCEPCLMSSKLDANFVQKPVLLKPSSSKSNHLTEIPR